MSCNRYFTEGANEVAFLNITGFRDCPLEDVPMLGECYSVILTAEITVIKRSAVERRIYRSCLQAACTWMCGLDIHPVE